MVQIHFNQEYVIVIGDNSTYNNNKSPVNLKTFIICWQIFSNSFPVYLFQIVYNKLRFLAHVESEPIGPVTIKELFNGFYY